jgi:hypothetical protein
MTLDEMAAELVEEWTANDPAMVAQWDRSALWDRAARLGTRIKSEARESGRPERAVLLDYLMLFKQPGVPGDGELA